jgi:hypothetical protein
VPLALALQRRLSRLPRPSRRLALELVGLALTRQRRAHGRQLASVARHLLLERSLGLALEQRSRLCGELVRLGARLAQRSLLCLTRPQSRALEPRLPLALAGLTFLAQRLLAPTCSCALLCQRLLCARRLSGTLSLALRLLLRMFLSRLPQSQVGCVACAQQLGRVRLRLRLSCGLGTLRRFLPTRPLLGQLGLNVLLQRQVPLLELAPLCRASLARGLKRAARVALELGALASEAGVEHELGAAGGFGLGRRHALGRLKSQAAVAPKGGGRRGGGLVVLLLLLAPCSKHRLFGRCQPRLERGQVFLGAPASFCHRRRHCCLLPLRRALELGARQRKLLLRLEEEVLL